MCTSVAITVLASSNANPLQIVYYVSSPGRYGLRRRRLLPMRDHSDASFDNWSINSLRLEPDLVKLLSAAGIHTIRVLEDRIRAGGLTDIRGIGDAKARRIKVAL